LPEQQQQPTRAQPAGQGSGRAGGGMGCGGGMSNLHMNRASYKSALTKTMVQNGQENKDKEELDTSNTEARTMTKTISDLSDQMTEEAEAM
jgi:hypothetical protein